MKSEFGKGLCYCLGLFLAHSNFKLGGIDANFRPPLWFNGASDHFYEMEIPENLPKTLKKRLINLKSKCLHWGHGFKDDAKEEDITWALQEAKDLLRWIDKYHGIKTIKGDFE